MAENSEVELTTAPETPLPTDTFQAEVASATFTAEDVAKARAQEKAKLYPQVEKLQEELASLKQREAEREAKEAERKAARSAREAEAAAEKKKQEESELEVRELLSKKEQEFQAQLAAERL